MLSAKARDGDANVSALERELEELVHALYDLTPEEIKLVEGTPKLGNRVARSNLFGRGWGITSPAPPNQFGGATRKC